VWQNITIFIVFIIIIIITINIIIIILIFLPISYQGAVQISTRDKSDFPPALYE